VWSGICGRRAFSPLPSRLEPYLSLACSHAWFLSAELHEWTPSSLSGLNSRTPRMRAATVQSSRKGLQNAILFWAWFQVFPLRFNPPPSSLPFRGNSLFLARVCF
jgi:hypothetical protein